jgi:hypothetical protein
MAMMVAGGMRVMVRAARAMAMVMKRVIARKRVIAIDNNNETTATETMRTQQIAVSLSTPSQ